MRDMGLLKAIRTSGYWSPHEFTAEERFEFLSYDVWKIAGSRGVDLPKFKAYCWRMSSRPESEFMAGLKDFTMV